MARPKKFNPELNAKQLLAEIDNLKKANESLQHLIDTQKQQINEMDSAMNALRAVYTNKTRYINDATLVFAKSIMMCLEEK